MITISSVPCGAWKEETGGQLTDAAADEGEEEGAVARDLGRDLELEQTVH